jgi:two-component system probable response regulator PhcQ
MESSYDYRKFAILYVDDEEKSLKYFAKVFDTQFRIYVATSAAEGLQILEAHQDEIGLLMTDQQMPGEKGVQLLEKARQLRPRIVRILATAHSDIDAAIQAVNTGAIYKYITKPWEIPDLEAMLRRGLEFFIVQRERDQLLQERLSAVQHLMITDRVVSLGILAAGLNHHIRNSLVAVRTFLDLAPAKLSEEKVDIQGLQNPQFWKEFYEQVQAQMKRITDMLNDLGVAAEPGEPSRQPVQLADVLAPALTKLKARFEEKKITVENKVPRSLPSLVVDHTKFHRLFELLLADELVNLPEGGRMVLEASELPHAAGSPAEVQFELHDNGPGLPEEAVRSVFNPFSVRNGNPQEYGINLMACYFIVYHHGGRIRVKSEPGVGATFSLTFPTNFQPRSGPAEEPDFLQKALVNETLWEKLLAGN